MDAKKLCPAIPRDLVQALKWSVAMLVIASLIGVGLPGNLSAAPLRIGPRLSPRPWSKPHPIVVRRLPTKVYGKLPSGVVRPAMIPRWAPRLVIPSRPAVVVHQGTQVVTEVKDLAVVAAPEFVPSRTFPVVRVDDRYLVTLLINGAETPVRLVGVDAPLVATGGEPPKPPEEARQFLQNLLAGELVYLDRDPNLAQKDAGGNLIAYKYRAPDGLLINLELIRQGYGLVAGGYKFGHQPAFISYEQRARAGRKGIWALAAGTDL